MTRSKERSERPAPRRKRTAAGSAETPAPARPSDDPDALRQQAEEQVRRNAETLRRFPVPTSAEPAFVFKP